MRTIDADSVNGDERKVSAGFLYYFKPPCHRRRLRRRLGRRGSGAAFEMVLAMPRTPG